MSETKFNSTDKLIACHHSPIKAILNVLFNYYSITPYMASIAEDRSNNDLQNQVVVPNFY